VTYHSRAAFEVADEDMIIMDKDDNLVFNQHSDVAWLGAGRSVLAFTAVASHRDFESVERKPECRSEAAFKIRKDAAKTKMIS